MADVSYYVVTDCGEHQAFGAIADSVARVAARLNALRIVTGVPLFAHGDDAQKMAGLCILKGIVGAGEQWVVTSEMLDFLIDRLGPTYGHFAFYARGATAPQNRPLKSFHSRVLC